MAVSLVVNDVRKSFRFRDVLKGVTFTLEGGALAITGANGSGKSTLLAIIAGLLPASGGDVMLNGIALRHPRARAMIGYVPEALVPLASLSAAEFLELMVHLKEPATAPDFSAVAHLFGKEMGTLSLGERRRVCLTAALIGTPPLLVLDEPSNGLDTLARQSIVQTLRAYRDADGTVLMATHDLSFARELNCARLHLDGGIIAPLHLG